MSICCGIGRGAREAGTLALSPLALLLAVLVGTSAGKRFEAFEGKRNARDASKDAKKKTLICFRVELVKCWIRRMKHRLFG